MSVILTAVLQHHGSDILLSALETHEWRFSIESQKIPHSITWTRHIPQVDSDVTHSIKISRVVPLTSVVADFGIIKAQYGSIRCFSVLNVPAFLSN